MPESISPEPAAPAPSTTPGGRFLVNVLWNWLGVAVNLFIGFVLSPVVVHRLGEERYGIWVLVFSLLDYFWFFDLGVNTAIVNFAARFQASGRPDKINELLNTALSFFSIISVTLASLSWLVSTNSAWLFPTVTSQNRSEFAHLILLTGVSWGGFVLLHIFTSCLDGFQRFDLTSRTWIAMLFFRGVGTMTVLLMGYGLMEMALVVVLGQLLCYLANFWSLRRVFPALRFSRSLVSLKMFKEMASYGAHSFVANSANLLLNQGPPQMIGHFLPVAAVGYYALPSRLLQYGVDAVSRVGLVTRSRSAVLDASQDHESVFRLGVFTNRYCFAMFMPGVMFLMLYAEEGLRLWMGNKFGLEGASVLRILAPAIALVMAGQFNSASILFGLNRHRAYARVILAEAVISVGLLWVIVPTYGIVGAALVTAGLMLLSRGMITPWLVCRGLNVSLVAYMQSIYLAPLLTAVPVVAIAWFLKSHGLPGRTWLELITAGALLSTLYLAGALFTTFAPEHRALMYTWVRRLHKTVA